MTPYGYRRASRNVVVEEPAEAAVVRRIFQMRAGGESVRKIARWLVESGRRSRSGSWSETQVKRVLRRRDYLGRTVFDSQGTAVAVIPPIIDQGLWDAVALVKRGEKPLGSNRTRGSGRLLSGILKCGSCLLMGNEGEGVRADMVIRYAGKGGRRYVYYACDNNHTGGRKSRPRPNPIRAEHIEKWVEKRLSRMAAALAIDPGRPSRARDLLERAAAILKETGDELARVYRQREEFHIGDDALADQMRLVMCGVAEKFEEADRVVDGEAAAEATARPPGELDEAWARMDIGAKRRALATIVPTIAVNLGGIELHLVSGEGVSIHPIPFADPSGSGGRRFSCPLPEGVREEDLFPPVGDIAPIGGPLVNQAGAGLALDLEPPMPPKRKRDPAKPHAESSKRNVHPLAGARNPKPDGNKAATRKIRS